MHDLDYNKVFALQEKAFQDEYFHKLCKEYTQAQERLECILQKLPEDQQADIGAYLDISQQMHFYLMALACNR